ncbi:MAG: serine/threonine-protein kinase [Planctomycetia bacterium]
MSQGHGDVDATLPPSNADGLTLSSSAIADGVGLMGGAGPPGYEIIEELGRGGMGLVYKANQQGLNRIVALKMILAGGHAREGDLTRFRTEAAAIARLHHPNIVQIYEVGEWSGLPFFSLEYCPGGSLDRKVRGTPLPAREAAGLVVGIARAIGEAHGKGILHRDLKPANVLIGGDGTPKITDFGLAKRIDDPSGQTVSGTVLGTPSYMSPEQAIGSAGAVGTATDIYGLGAVLYELLTGRPPFRAATPLDTLLQVIRNEPAPPRLLNPQVDKDLETICLKCLEKDPSDRYRTAGELAEDLSRYLMSEPISARSINLMERLGRTLQKSQIDAGFEEWGSVLLWFAAIVLGSQVALFVVIGNRQPVLLVYATQAGQFLLMGLTLWCHRSPRMFAMKDATRSLVSLWCGYLVACGLVAIVSQRLVGTERLYDCFLYPYWAIVSGLAFIAMASTHWGWFYGFGSAFFALAALLPFVPAAGPLAFGALWATSLVMIGFRLQAKARAAESGADQDHVDGNLFSHDRPIVHTNED